MITVQETPSPATSDEFPSPARREVLKARAKRVLKRLDAEFAYTEPAGPLETPLTQQRLPIAWYTDQQRWDREVSNVFKARPLLLAYSDELRGPKSYKAMDIVGVPVLLTREAGGTARAFLNVCRHRGAVLAEPGCGKAARFTCPYHAWTYDVGGRLVGVPMEENFGKVDRELYGLTPLPVEERHGMIWGLLTPGKTLELDDWLEGVEPLFEEYSLDGWSVFHTVEFPGPNWKLARDGYMETYHFPFVHQKSFDSYIIGTIPPSIERLGYHQEHTVAHSSIKELLAQPEECWRPEQYLGTAIVLFPNTTMGFQPLGRGAGVGYHGRVAQIESVFPGKEIGQSVTRCTVLISEPLRDDQQVKWLQGIASMVERSIREEDYPMGDRIQMGLASGMSDHFLIGGNETGISLWHETLNSMADNDGI